MAMTLFEASKRVSAEVKRGAVIEMFARNSQLVAAMPFEDVPGGSSAQSGSCHRLQSAFALRRRTPARDLLRRAAGRGEQHRGAEPALNRGAQALSAQVPCPPGQVPS